MTEPQIRTVPVCEPCLNGEGEMCHTPGCVFIRGRTPPDGAYGWEIYCPEIPKCELCWSAKEVVNHKLPVLRGAEGHHQRECVTIHLCRQCAPDGIKPA